MPGWAGWAWCWVGWAGLWGLGLRRAERLLGAAGRCWCAAGALLGAARERQLCAQALTGALQCAETRGQRCCLPRLAWPGTFRRLPTCSTPDPLPSLPPSCAQVRLQAYEALRRLVAAAQRLFPGDSAGNPSPQVCAAPHAAQL